MENYNRRGFFFPVRRPEYPRGQGNVGPQQDEPNGFTEGRLQTEAIESRLESQSGHQNLNNQQGEYHQGGFPVSGNHNNETISRSNQDIQARNVSRQDIFSHNTSRQQNETQIENDQNNESQNSQQAEFSQDIQNNAQARVSHSGNSDVDVNLNVEIDTTAIAYALLCSMLATNQMTEKQFESAVRKMEGLTKGKKEKKKKVEGQKQTKKFKTNPSSIKMYDPNKRG